jgi:hypothetical protein
MLPERSFWYSEGRELNAAVVVRDRHAGPFDFRQRRNDRCGREVGHGWEIRNPWAGAHDEKQIP